MSEILKKKREKKFGRESNILMKLKIDAITNE